MACGCNRCNQRRQESGFRCGKFQQYDDFLDIFEGEERSTGPYTWNGYVWYDIEVTYSGPFFGAYGRPEQKNNSCGCNR